VAGADGHAPLRAAARLVVALMLAALGWPGTADAHAVLVKSSPARRATLSHPPERVELWFNERLEPAYSSLSVTGESGTRVDLGDAAVGPEDARKLSVSLAALAPGSYTVHFRVLSVDGHIVESSFAFVVK
jgi:methionine-rich copper-binding protein CopC